MESTTDTAKNLSSEINLTSEIWLASYLFWYRRMEMRMHYDQPVGSAAEANFRKVREARDLTTPKQFAIRNDMAQNVKITKEVEEVLNQARRALTATADKLTGPAVKWSLDAIIAINKVLKDNA